MGGVDDGPALAALLEGRSCAVAESCTGGLVAQGLARLEGSGEWFRGGVVAYQRRAKYEVLGVTPGPVVNARAAEEMARGAARLLDADVAVAVTGAAGPDPQDGAPAGTVFIATWIDGVSVATEHHFEGEPGAVCEQAQRVALAELLHALQSSKAPRSPR